VPRRVFCCSPRCCSPRLYRSSCTLRSHPPGPLESLLATAAARRLLACTCTSEHAHCAAMTRVSRWRARGGRRRRLTPDARRRDPKLQSFGCLALRSRPAAQHDQTRLTGKGASHWFLQSSLTLTDGRPSCRVSLSRSGVPPAASQRALPWLASDDGSTLRCCLEVSVTAATNPVLGSPLTSVGRRSGDLRLPNVLARRHKGVADPLFELRAPGARPNFHPCRPASPPQSAVCLAAAHLPARPKGSSNEQVGVFFPPSFPRSSDRPFFTAAPAATMTLFAPRSNLILSALLLVTLLISLIVLGIDGDLVRRAGGGSSDSRILEHSQATSLTPLLPLLDMQMPAAPGPSTSSSSSGHGSLSSLC
jgi:hypothetical protein